VPRRAFPGKPELPGFEDDRSGHGYRGGPLWRLHFEGLMSSWSTRMDRRECATIE
jgi:hypothetical protein